MERPILESIYPNSVKFGEVQERFPEGIPSEELATLERWYTRKGIVGSPKGTPSAESHLRWQSNDSIRHYVLRAHPAKRKRRNMLLRLHE